MFRAWYRFYSRVFNTYHERASLRASERYGTKNEWIKTIWLLTCNNLFITYYMHKKNQATKLKYKKVALNSLEAAIPLIKLQAILPAKFDARSRLKYNVQPDWSNQIITVYLIEQFKPWSDMISFHEMISYHFMGIIFSHGFITLISTHNVYYYTSDSLWKVWLVESIQSIHNSLWTWHDRCNICCRYCIYHVKFNVCLVTKPLGVFSSETQWLSALLLFLRMNYVKNV